METGQEQKKMLVTKIIVFLRLIIILRHFVVNFCHFLGENQFLLFFVSGNRGVIFLIQDNLLVCFVDGGMVVRLLVQKNDCQRFSLLFLRYITRVVAKVKKENFGCVDSFSYPIKKIITET